MTELSAEKTSSPSQLALFADLASDFFVVLEPDGVLVDANPAFAALVGKALDSLTRSGFGDLVAEADRADFLTALSQAAGSAERVEHRARVVDAAGVARLIRWFFVFHAESSRVCGIGRDLTHELAARREAAMTAVLEHAENVAWAIDRDGTYFVHTGGGLKNLGMVSGQLLGLNHFQLYANVPPIQEETRRALAGEVVVETNTMVFDRFFTAITAPFRAPDGEIIGITGLTSDITALKRTQLELEEKLALIEEQQRTIQDLSTPIIEVWKGVVAVPLLGALNDGRAEKLMERLLEYIVAKQIRYSVLDMTGADTVDTTTADALVRIVQAVSLLGAEALLVGLSPSVAQTIVALGMSLTGMKTLRNLEEGLRYCMKQK